MNTDPITLVCDYCGARPGSSCHTWGRTKYTSPHSARRYDAHGADLVREASAAPEGTVLGDAWREVRGAGTIRQYAFLEAVEWMQERNK